MTTDTPNPVGRPTKFKPEYCDLAFSFALLGATDAELAQALEITESTLNLWKLEYPEFSEALNDGKIKADARVAKSFYQKALDGDVGACKSWLTNRRGKDWKDKQSTDVEIKTDYLDLVKALREHPAGA
jgi:hypothetical protein